MRISSVPGGDTVSNALWRAGKGGAVEALGATRAVQTDLFVLLTGINDMGKKGAGKGLEMDMVGGVYELGCQLKNGLGSKQTRIHILELPLLPMYTMRMREAAKNINGMLRKVPYLYDVD